MLITTITIRRFKFLFRLIRLYLFGRNQSCPYCGSMETFLISRKYYFLEMRECLNCTLLFRWPKETVAFNKKYYKSLYSEDDLTTNLPIESELKLLIEKDFADTEKKFSDKIKLIQQVMPSGLVLDFGCSWGYFMVQLERAGYQTIGFEISTPRAMFGEGKLGLQIFDNLDDFNKISDTYFDAIFTSHVLEHLPNLQGVFEMFHRLLHKSGMLFIWVPNGEGLSARKYGIKWGGGISEKHPLLFTSAFFYRNLPECGFDVACFSNTDQLPSLERIFEKRPVSSLDGDELIVMARKHHIS